MTPPVLRRMFSARRPSRFVPWCAAAYALAFFVAGAAADVGLGDEGAHIAAAVNLTPIEAPGTPLAAMAGAFATLLPVGPFAFRVSLASALCAAVVLGLFAHAAELSLRALFPARAELAPLWALGCALGLAQTPLFCAQALRPQPFTAQYVVGLATVVALLRFETAEPHGDKRMLYLAMFLHGLAFANHHALALLLLGASAPTLGRLFARRGFMGVMGHAAAAVVGFSAFAYVPIRLGYGPETLAERNVFVRSVAFLHHEPFPASAEALRRDVLAHLEHGLGGTQPWLGFFLAVFALIGSARFLPISGPRRFAFLWLLVLVLPASGLAVAIRPLAAEDAFGVLIPCAMALFVLAAAGLWTTLELLFGGFPRVAPVCALALVLASAWGVSAESATYSRAREMATDALDELLRRNVPVDAFVLTEDASLFYHHLGAEAEEVLRTDTSIVPLFADAPPKWLEAMYLREAALDPMITSYLAGDGHGLTALHALAAQHDVLFDFSASPSARLCPLLVPDGFFLRAIADAPSPLQRRLADDVQALRFWRFSRAVAGLSASSRARVAGLVARASFARGLCAATIGDAAGARIAVHQGQSFVPRLARLSLLLRAVDTRVPVEPNALLRAVEVEESR